MQENSSSEKIMPAANRHFGTEVVAEEVNTVKQGFTVTSPVFIQRDLQTRTSLWKEVVAGGQLSGLESKGWKAQGRN